MSGTFFGNNQIKKIFYSTNEIKKVYNGNVEVWSGGDDPFITLKSDTQFTVYHNSSGSTYQNDGTIYYSTDKTNWTSWNAEASTASTTISSDSSGYLYIRQDGGTKFARTLYFTGATNLSASGNIMTLLDYQNVDSVSLSQYAFSKLFQACTSLVDVSNLILPATTLAISCCNNMFSGCTSLTTAPALPATTLATNCYSSMFSGCTSLTTAPALPATTLANGCYNSMFQKCSALTTAPALPATTLASSCYSSMFYGCTSLTTAPALPATTLATNCYSSMFQKCSALTVPARVGDGTTSYTYKSNVMKGMYSNCSSLYVYTSSSGHTAFFKGLSSTSGSSMSGIFSGCYIDGTKQSTYDGVAEQQYYY